MPSGTQSTVAPDGNTTGAGAVRFKTIRSSISCPVEAIIIIDSRHTRYLRLRTEVMIGCIEGRQAAPEGTYRSDFIAFPGEFNSGDDIRLIRFARNMKVGGTLELQMN